MLPFLLLLLGIAGLLYGTNLVIGNATLIARRFGWSDFAVGIVIGAAFGKIRVAKLGHRVGNADRGYEAHIDRDFRQLGTFVPHLQDWTIERSEMRREACVQPRVRVGAAQNDSLR